MHPDPKITLSSPNQGRSVLFVATELRGAMSSVTLLATAAATIAGSTRWDLPSDSSMASSARASPTARLAVPVAVDGSYSVVVDGEAWFKSGSTFLRHGGREYSSDNQSLALVSTTKIQGGGWDATTMQWKTSDGDVPFVTVVNVSNAGFAVFTQTFPRAISGASTGDRDSIISSFPSLTMAAKDTKGVVSFKGAGDYQVHIGNWSAATGIAPTDLITSGIGDTCPTVVFAQDMSTSLVLSPFSNFMAHNQKFGAGDRNPTLTLHPSLAYGVMGGVDDVPSGYTTSTIISLGSGMSSAMDTWGDRLLSHYGQKRRYDYRRDLATRKLGYATDNGAFYYYNPEPGENYQQTMVDVKTYADSVRIPYHYTLLDSWWYYQDPKTEGVTTWDARPDVFPAGLRGVRNLTGWPQQLHNRYWAASNTYRTKYHFICDGRDGADVCVPDSQLFWNDLMKNKSDTGMFMYLQDWLWVTFNRSKSLADNATLGRDWMIQMDYGARKSNTSIQFCMTYLLRS